MGGPDITPLFDVMENYGVVGPVCGRHSELHDYLNFTAIPLIESGSP